MFAPDRKSERPVAHLENFSGILHVDGYAETVKPVFFFSNNLIALPNDFIHFRVRPFLIQMKQAQAADSGFVGQT